MDVRCFFKPTNITCWGHLGTISHHRDCGFESLGWAVTCRHLLTSRTDLFFRRICLIRLVQLFIHIHCWNCFIFNCNVHCLSWCFWIRGFACVNHQDSGSCVVFLFVSSPKKKQGIRCKKTCPCHCDPNLPNQE